MHKLIQLPYAYDALEPIIDAKTMEIHHSKHHQGYVDKLNKALADHEELQTKSIENLISDLGSVPDNIRTAVRNNGGGVANHNLFFTTIGPGGNALSKSDLSEAINECFGSFQAFQEAFNEAATGRFGSGWAWLSLASSGKLIVESTANQDSPYMFGRTPIVGLDVWEHAYYLKYQNRRAEYVSQWWDVIDWKAVGNRFEECCTTGKATS